MDAIKNKGNIILIVLYIFLIAFSKLMPHPANFSPLLALAIFGGAMAYRKKSFILITLFAWYLSDFLYNNFVHSEYVTGKGGLVFFSGYMIWVYAGMLLVILLASKLLHKFNYGRLFGTALLSAVVFYLVTNFGAWLSMPELYTRDIQGLMNSYVAAIPFFRATLLGNIVFSFLVFGLYELIVKRFHVREPLFQVEKAKS